MLKGYRTYMVAVILAAVGFLAELSPGTWQNVVDDPRGGAGMIIGGVLMAIMRVITTTPPGKSPDNGGDGKS